MTDPSNSVPPVSIPNGLGRIGEEVAQMLMAVGFVAWASAQLDVVLRALFCGLEDSKYAAVTAAGQGTDWLRQACEALAKRRDDVSPHHEDELRKHLKAVKDQMGKRNGYIHSVWHIDEYADNAAYFAQSRRHNYLHAAHLANPGQVIETGRTLLALRQQIATWMDSAGIKGDDLATQMMWDYFWNQPSDDGDE